MLNKVNLSSSSLKSRGVVSISAVHPEEAPALDQEQTHSVDQDKTNNSVKNVNQLFAAFTKAKKSLFININTQRVIHIIHYAQKENDLYNENSFSDPSDRNYTTTVLIFFIHGVGGSSRMWDPQINYFLSQGYEIVSIDLLGHGLSSKPRDYNAYVFKALATDVLLIFDKCHKQRNVLIGHSYGSSFCTLVSRERPNLVYKTVLISGGGPTTLMPEQCGPFCLPLPMFVCIRSTLVKIFRRMAFHVETSEKIRTKISTFEISSFTLKAVMQGQNWPESDEEYHADLAVPVLLIYGLGDQFVSIDEEEWMKETIFGAQLEVIDNAGHMVMLETPTRVNELIHNFLNRDSSTRSTSQINNENISSQDKPNDEKTPAGSHKTLSEGLMQSDDIGRSNVSLRSTTQLTRNTTCLSRTSIRSNRGKTMF